jgi:hypothetical protein
MHALSVRQPYAEAIASGAKRREFRSWAPRIIVGSDLLVVASRTPGPGYGGEPQGVAICVVRVAKITGTEGDYAWHLENPRRVVAWPIKGSAALFRVPDGDILFATEHPTIARVVLAAEGDRVRIARDSERFSPRAKTPRAKPSPYTFGIGDRVLRGEGASTPAAARKRARELVTERGAEITIFRDGLAIGGES